MRFSKGIVAATIILLTSTIALAQLAMTGAGGISGGSIPPGFSSFYIDFANGFASGTTYPNVTTTRTCTNCTVTAPDGNGNYAQFANNVPRIRPGTGLWAEEARTNLFLNSGVPVTQSIAVAIGATYSVSAVGAGSVTMSGAFTGTALQGTNVSGTALTTTLTVTTAGVTGTFVSVQVENNSLINSSVATGAQTVTNSGTSTCTSGTYGVSGGTGTPATMTGVASAGVITSLTTLAQGSYTVFPPSPAALTGTGCSGSPTVTLTPANNAAQAFATTPIITSGSAGVRGADVTTITVPPALGSSYSMYGKFNPEAPAAYSVLQWLFSIDDGTTSNRSGFNRGGGTGNPAWFGETAGSTYINAAISVAVHAQGANGKYGAAFAPSNQTAVFNAGTVATNGSGTPYTSATPVVHVGSRADGAIQANGSIAAIGINPTVALTVAQLQAATTLP